MATRQYIGARYVPKFYENSDGTAEWRSGVIYEPLTIVTWNGNSYTSKKLVPATVGDPSSNSAYWVATGVFNEQVESLRQDLEALEDAQEAARDNQRNKRVILISDSYGNAFDGNPSWMGICTAAIPYETESHYLGGAGFGYSTSGQYANLRFDAFAQTFMPSVEDPETVTDIVLAAGANDANQIYDGNYTAQEVKAGFNSFAAYVKSICPAARLHIAFCGRVFNMFMLPSYLIARNCYRDMAEENSYSDWIANCEYALHNESLLRSDQLHPSAEGMKNIGKMIASFLKGGDSEIYIDGGECTINPIEISGVSTTVTGANIQSFTDNGVTKVYSFPKTGTSHGALGILEIRAPGSGSYITAGGFSNLALFTLQGCNSMGLDGLEMTPVNFMLATAAHGNQYRQGAIGIRNKTVFAQIYGESLEDVVFIYLMPFSMITDSMRC